MRATFVTVFENLVKFYFEDSILNRALRKGLFSVDFVNPRDFAQNRYKKIDDTKVGGGAGMLMEAPPLCEAIRSVKGVSSRVVVLTPAGKRFVQKDAKRLSEFEHLIFVCGRYEGIDERVIEKEADEVFSLGDFVLTGGELAALCIFDAIARNIPGVLGNADSLCEESFNEAFLEAPAFTKPNVFEGSGVPSEFLKGNHSKISALKNELSYLKTLYHRPDLLRDQIKD